MLVDEEAELRGTVLRGTDIDFEWTIDNVTCQACVTNVGETQSEVFLTHEFNEIGLHTVVLNASNVLGYGSTSKVIEVLMGLSGINVVMVTASLIETTDTAEFNVTASAQLIQSAGTLSLRKNIGNESYDLISPLEVTENGLIVKLEPTNQGDEQVSIIVFSIVDEKKFVFDIAVWDKLNVSLASDVAIMSASGTIELYFANPPPSGFEYVVDYDNGENKTSSANILYSPFNVAPWTYSYTTSGAYNVTLVANNAKYEVTSYIWITIQYPLPDSDIAVVNPHGHQLPFPDGILYFSIEMTEYHPTPDNVTCKYNFDDESDEISEDVDFSHGTLTKRNYTYKAPGVYDANIHCSNLVSQRVWVLSIEIKMFTVNDFELRYRDLVGLNSSGTVQTTFDITLFDIIRVPPFINLTWDFGDSSGQIAEVMQSYTKDHVFKKRGNFLVSLKVEIFNDTATLLRDFRAGVIDFEVDIYQALIITGVFTFTVGGIEGSNVQYVIESGIEDINKKINVKSGSVQFSYNTYGAYLPTVTGWNDTFAEYVKLTKPILTDNPIEILELVVSTNVVSFPPGHFVMNISIPTGSLPLPNLHCEIDFDEVNDDKMINVTYNVTDVDPLVIDYTFKTLNYKNIHVYCYNLANNGTNTTIVQVVNPCFASDGMFDEQFGMPDTPLMVYTAMNIDLTNRMEILCFNYTIQFVWNICQYESTSTCADVEDFPYPKMGTMHIQKGTLSEGLYQITLIIKFAEFEGAYAVEKTYIYFVKRRPYAFIVGGFLRMVKSGRFQVDGVTESFDIDGEPGRNKLNDKLVIDYDCIR